MRKILYIVILLLALASCRSVPQPSVVEREIVVRDSIVYSVRDSIVYVPVEVSANVVRDSSHVETSLATSEAWVDGGGYLHHTITNKAGMYFEYHTKESQSVRDSIIRVPEPYPVTEYVEKELSGWQVMWIQLGQIFGVLMFLSLIAVIAYYLAKKRVGLR